MKVISIADYNSTITNEGLEATEEGVETQSKELSPEGTALAGPTPGLYGGRGGVVKTIEELRGA